MHKSIPSHKANRAALISVSLAPQPDTSLHCKTTETGLVNRAVCVLTPPLSLVLIAPTHGETVS